MNQLDKVTQVNASVVEINKDIEDKEISSSLNKVTSKSKNKDNNTFVSVKDESNWESF